MLRLQPFHFFLLLFVLGGLIFSYYAMKAPTLSEKIWLQQHLVRSMITKITLIADLGAEKRINVTANEIPTDLVNAIVAIEDHRFFNHRGSTSFGSAVPSFTTYEEEVKVGQPWRNNWSN